MSNYAQIETHSKTLPVGKAPVAPQPLYQERGARYSRALPYELHVSAQVGNGRIGLRFRNTGKQGAVFHVYDRLHLDQIPRRYTVEVGKNLSDDFWNAFARDNGHYDLWVYGPNGFVRTFKGTVVPTNAAVKTEINLSYEPVNAALRLKVRNEGTDQATLTVTANAYRADGPWELTIPAGGTAKQHWSIAENGNWYDFTVVGALDFERRFAGRLESGKHGISDPAMGRVKTL
jgi:phospholipase C